MAAVGNNVIIRYIYRGEEGEIIPREATHITVIAKFLLSCAFQGNHNIIEVICHDNVEKIESCAFYYCPNLRRVIMRGVKEVEEYAFYNCFVLTDVECGKLEIIRQFAFRNCDSLRSINLPSARIVGVGAFDVCKALTDVKFSNNLERIDGGAFYNCKSLERITIPLKDGIITYDNTFQGCENLKHIDAIEGKLLDETVSALLMEDWRKDMNQFRILRLPSDGGDKAQAIRTWIRSILRKLIHYQAEHHRILSNAATTLQHVLPRDILMNNILPFLKLPPNTFEVEESGDEDSEEEDSEDELELEYSSKGEDSEEDSDDEEEDDYLGEERNDDAVEGQEEEEEENDQDETARRGRDKRQRR